MRYFVLLTLSILSFCAGYIIINPDSQANSFIQGFYRPAAVVPILRAPTISPLVDRQIAYLSSLKDGRIRYIDKNSGKAYRLDLSTQEEEVIKDSLMINVRNIIWNPINDNFIAALGEGTQTRLKFNNTDDGSSYYLGQQAVSAAFSPNGDKVAQVQKNKDGISVSIYSLSGAWEKDIFKARLDNGVLYWPDPDYMVLRSKSAKENYIFMKISTNGRVDTILEQKEEPREIWRGASFIFSKKEAIMPYSVGLMDTRKNNPVYFMFNTPSSKCAWLEEIELICGLIGEDGHDNLYRVPLNGDPRPLLGQFQNLKVERLLYDLKTKKLIIINSGDDHIYSLPIE